MARNPGVNLLKGSINQLPPTSRDGPIGGVFHFCFAVYYKKRLNQINFYLIFYEHYTFEILRDSVEVGAEHQPRSAPRKEEV